MEDIHNSDLMLFQLLSLFGPILLILLSVFVACIAYWYYVDILNPVTLFITAWFIPYGLYLFYPYPPSIQPRLSLLAHIVIIGGAISFLCGHFIASPPGGLLENRKRQFPHASVVVAMAIGSMFIVSSIAFAIQFVGAGGVEGLLSQTGSYERNFMQGPLIDDVFYLIFIVVFLSMVYLERDVRGVAGILLIIVGFIFVIATLHRQQIILMGILVITATNYYHYRIRLRHALIVVATGVAALIAVVNSLSWGVTTGIIDRSGVLINPLVSHIYWYVAMGMQNIEIMVSKIPPIHFDRPIYILEFLWTITATRRVAGLDGSNVTSPFDMTFGTWSFVIPFYVDAGLLGVGIGAGVVGYGVTRLYGMVRQRQNVGVVFIYGLAAFALTMTFFNNFFTKAFLWKLAVQFVLLLITMNIIHNHIVYRNKINILSIDIKTMTKNSHSYDVYYFIREKVLSS